VTKALDSLDTRLPDCLVSDYEMPERDGIDLVRHADEAWPDLPVILFTGRGSEAIASEALRAGATDYLRKRAGTEQYELLANRIQNAVRQARSRDRLHETQAEYATVFESAQAGLLLVDASGQGFCYRRCNPRVPALTGLDRTDIVGQTPREVFGPENARAITGAYRACLRRGEPVEHTLTLDLPVGRVVHDTTVAPVTSNGGAVQLVVSFHDITERRERERELRAERRFVGQTLDALEDVFYVLDTDGTLRRWNRRATELTGYDRADLDGLAALDLFPPEDRESVAAAIETALRDGESTVEADLRTADGERIPHEFRGACLTDANGNTTGVVGIGRDLRSRRQRERRFRALVENSNDVISVADADGRFLYLSPSVESILGYEPAALTGEAAWEYVHPDDRERLRNWFGRVAAGDTPTDPVECRVRHADGSWRWMEADANSQLDNPAVEGYVVNSRDVTARKQREAALQRERDRLDEFAGVISHDLRNPLSVARARTELAARECDSDHLSDVLDALSRMESMTDDILTLARRGETIGEREPVALGEVADTCWHTVETGGATLTVDGAGTLAADRSRLTQVFENLFRNAVDHGGESVTVVVGALDDGAGFYVADDGPGIPETDRPDVFDGGFTTGSGTGLGLAVVERICSAHGWTVTATESASGGTRIEVTGVDSLDRH